MLALAWAADVDAAACCCCLLLLLLLRKTSFAAEWLRRRERSNAERRWLLWLANKRMHETRVQRVSKGFHNYLLVNGRTQ